MDRQYSFPKNEDNNGEHEEREGDEKGNIRDMFGTRPGPGGPATSSTSDAGNTGNTGIGRIPILSSPIPAVNPLLEASSRSSWLPILENSNQLVLYNPTSHALTITPSSLPPVPISFPRSNVNTSSAMVPTRKMLRSQSHPEESLRNHGHDLDLALGVGHTQNHGPGHLTTSDATREVVLCPMCTRPLPPGFGIGRMRPPGHGHGHGNGSGIGLGLGLAHGLESSSSFGGRHGFSRRAPNYFQLLEEANFEAQSRPASPPLPAISPLSPDVPTIESIESIDPSLESLASFASTSTTTSVLRHGHGHGHGQERTQIKPDALGRIRNRLQVADGSTVKGGGNLGGGGVSMDSRPRAGTGTGAEAEAEVEEGGATAPTIVDNDSVPGTPKPRFGANSMAQGYFAAFFREEKRLGMGANGSVYLCQVGSRLANHSLFHLFTYSSIHIFTTDLTFILLPLVI